MHQCATLSEVGRKLTIGYTLKDAISYIYRQQSCRFWSLIRAFNCQLMFWERQGSVTCPYHHSLAVVCVWICHHLECLLLTTYRRADTTGRTWWLTAPTTQSCPWGSISTSFSDGSAGTPWQLGSPWMMKQLLKYLWRWSNSSLKGTAWS